MQACYAGAIGARGIHALQGYGQAEPTYDNKAYTFSSTYHDGTLKMYSHHPAQPSHPGESPFMSHPYLFPFFLPCFALAVPTVLSSARAFLVSAFLW
jgi:hypothetical protein